MIVAPLGRRGAGPSGAPAVPRVHVRYRMGTLLALTLEGPTATCDLAAGRGFALAAALERMMTRFDEASDLNRVGRAAGRFVPVPREFARALSLARRLAALTGGAFDPTVGPLVDLWRRAGGASTTPPADTLASTRAVVDWRRLEVRGDRVRLRQPGMALDLDGFGKGWAAERIASLLRRIPDIAGLVNFGESSLATVTRPRRRGWRILVRQPAGGYAGSFTLTHGGCSTSSARAPAPGHAGARHVDPRAGTPVAHRAQVTVIARTAAVAEAASTALLVLGRPAMDRLARRLRVHACWIDGDGIATTPGFHLTPLDRRLP